MIYSKRFKIITVHIQSVLHESECNVDSICRDLSVSRSTLHRVIKSHTGLSATAYVNDLRLQRGAGLLQKNDDPIKIVAIKVGFKDPKYFSRLFKRKFGVSPQEILREVNEI